MFHRSIARVLINPVRATNHTRLAAAHAMPLKDANIARGYRLYVKICPQPTKLRAQKNAGQIYHPTRVSNNSNSA
jgi:hypothetical protein